MGYVVEFYMTIQHDPYYKNIEGPESLLNKYFCAFAGMFEEFTL